MSFLSQKNMIFCLKNLIFSEYERAIANRSWEWNNLSNVIYFQNKVWYLRCSIFNKFYYFWNFLNTKWFSLNYCYFLLQKIWYFFTHFLQNPELWPPGVTTTCSPRTIWHWGGRSESIIWSTPSPNGLVLNQLLTSGGPKKHFFASGVTSRNNHLH